MSRAYLAGCRPEPMASYLKALAVLRLVSEQADRGAAGWWGESGFWLESKLDEVELENFFLRAYRPTPVVAPWNGGSGFYEGDRTDGLDQIMHSDSPRFGAYKEAIRAIQQFPEMPDRELSVGVMLSRVEANAKEKQAQLALEVRKKLAGMELPKDPLSMGLEEFERWKESLPKKSVEFEAAKKLLAALRKLRTAAKRTGGASKEELVRVCRNRLDDVVIDWLDAAIVLRSDASLAYPPILGTAGNEGRLDYTNNFMCRLAELLLEENPMAAPLLANALFGRRTSGLTASTVGQHDPGRAGGFNQGPGIEHSKIPTNPWNFVLTIEGAIAWAAGVGRRQSVGGSRVASSPFTVEAKAIGYSSSGTGDGDSVRGEIWAPLWGRQSSYEEIRFLLREGRAEIGRKEACDGLQFAQAAASLGVDRGVTQFVRYELLKRRGDSFVALPAGRFPVRGWREVDLLTDLDPLLTSRPGKDEPGQATSLVRGVESAVYEFLLHGGALRMQRIVAAAGRLERFARFERGGRFKRPRITLRAEWLAAADDGSTEFRLAAALASLSPDPPLGSFQSNLEDGQESAWRGGNLAGRLASVLRRRTMDAARLGAKCRGLRAGLCVEHEDACAVLDSGLDESYLEDLLFGLCLIGWRSLAAKPDVRERLREVWRQPADRRVPREWRLLKLLFLPAPVVYEGKEITVKAEPSLPALLEAGRIREACSLAQRRLRAAGVAPIEADFEGANLDGVRLAASLLIPVGNVAKLVESVVWIRSEGMFTRR